MTLVDPKLMAMMIAVLSILSGVRVLLDHFAPPDNKITYVLGKIVDFVSGNVKH